MYVATSKSNWKALTVTRLIEKFPDVIRNINMVNTTGSWAKVKSEHTRTRTHARVNVVK